MSHLTFCSLLFFVTIALSAITDDPVSFETIDLHYLIHGLGVRERQGTQRYWISQRELLIDLERTGFRTDVLWEVNVHSDISGAGINNCEYSIGFLLNGVESPRVEVRSGGFGSENVLTSSFLRSSSVLFIRGAEVDLTATHLYISLDSCYVGRYVTRMQFDRWNGQAYLMDWSHSPSENFQRSGDFEDPLIRLDDFHEVINPPNTYTSQYLPVQRDSTIRSSGSYWSGEFFFDVSPFTDAGIFRPILDLWFYKPAFTSGVVAFDICDSDLSGCNSPVDYGNPTSSFVSYYSSNRVNGFVRAKYDYRIDLMLSNFGEDTTPTIGIRSTSFDAAFPPYAKLWGLDNTDEGAVPFLMDLTIGDADRTVCNTVSGVAARGLEYRGLGLTNWACQDSSANVEVIWRTPEILSTVTRPWMQWYEWDENGDQEEFGYTIMVFDEVIHTSEYDLSGAREISGMEFQVSLNRETVPLPITMEVRMTGAQMAFNGFAPVYDGSLDCGGIICPADNGDCFEDYVGAVCICKNGWEGEDCQTPTIDCPRFACLNGGVCNDWTGFYNCTCADGYGGDHCERVEDYCPQAECLNEGVCVSQSGDPDFVCDCQEGWGGTWCEIDLNDCHLDPFGCKNGAECMPLSEGGYTCECTEGWTGYWCERRVECEDDVNPCLNGGVCNYDMDTQSTVCLCPGNFYGAICEESFIDFNLDCRYSAMGCMNDGVCTRDANMIDHRCHCLNPNWVGDFCEEPLVCTEDRNPCMNGSTCSYFEGRAVCTCTAGWFGTYCDEDKLEYFSDCRYVPGGCNSGSCVEIIEDGESMWTCDCPSQYTGMYCETPDVCSPGVNPCVNSDYCSMGMNGQAECHCYGGWVGQYCDMSLSEYISDRFGNHIMDCRQSLFSCKNGSCEEVSEGVWACECNGHWRGDRCTEANFCDPNPCMNNGVCSSDENNEPLCHCPSGYTGSNCEMTFEEFLTYDCPLVPCRNGGVCAEGICKCTNAWTGEFCEEPIACVINPCMNNGRCSARDDGTPLCICPGHYFGDRCQHTREIGIDDCRVYGCGMNGECGNFGDEYVCRCSGGYSGESCEVHPQCNPNPCLNEGICRGWNDQFVCECEGMWSGSICNMMITDRIEEIEVAIENEVEEQVISMVTVSAFDDVDNIAGDLSATQEGLEMIQNEIDLARADIRLVSTETTQARLALSNLDDQFATQQEIDEIRALLEEIMN